MHRGRGALCAVAVAALLATVEPAAAVAQQRQQESPAQAPDTTRTQRIAGVDVLPRDYGTDDSAARPSAAAIRAFGKAFALAQRYPDDFGYPWFDAKTNQVTVNSVGDRGRSLAAGLKSDQPAIKDVRPTARSYRELERVKHEAIGLTSKDVPDGEAIFETALDGKNGRVLITVKRVTTPLVSALARRYGAESIAVVPGSERLQGSPQDRKNDTSPFYGGSTINVPAGGCSSGFPWIYGGQYMMVSAGHCASQGGSVSTPAQNMGTVTEGTRENWNNGDGQGTQLFPGQTRFRGDLSLIELDPGRQSVGRVYRGGPNSGIGDSASVRGIWQRRAFYGDQYCTDGERTGELCGWRVSRFEFDHRYSDGTVVRNAVRGVKRQQCTLGGDSGGPLYTVNDDGSVTGKGIHSGGGGGGDDSWGGIFDPCFEIFTDIRDAWEGLPGIPLTQ
ncbi:hypothetical protein [Streptomyces sp. NPDC003077]|uniref:hypothetical protein n=1 Tax=Streptomyces sp. NPDC003077 TaxID=3154443 RepID=UPI0033A5A156